MALADSPGPGAVIRLPQALGHLCDLRSTIGLHVEAAGNCFLECFAGGAIFTLAIMFRCIPAIRPWDSKYGKKYDVLRHGHIIPAAIADGRVGMVHMGTPCQSMTLARFPQLHSWQSVWGKWTCCRISMR